MIERKDLPKRNEKNSQYVYFVRIGDMQDRLFKIGTTNDPFRRMREHEKAYGKKISVIWLSPPLTSRFTTLRVEEKMIAYWRENKKTWDYLRNDRFTIPSEVEKVTIKIRKNYEIPIE